MKTIDINKVKIEAVHTGLLEVIIALKEARNKVNALMDTEELEPYIKRTEKLGNISDTLCEFGTDIAELIGVFFFDRAEEEINKQIEN
ncbi:hypothetical protein M2480_001770 [Parabacteroides sp. PFB2-12]|uniref:hypothetical protein n=1 Tax=unclassified Parabacteroides TaxID=2649774 RepID=UPI0024753485|nr:MULTISPECIES: hypothetical protein [unclassified Parabacteroides]MDH6343144.1 hypothetical protein [Parabacteroides sp. PM6-13]MDH6390788.1 hypothetical protein [Parabacteroides sp. PFB2-12]